MKKLITLFAGSSLGNDDTIARSADALGKAIGQEGFDLIYGGGTGGIMGRCAQVAQDNGARIIAVPTLKYSHEPQLPNATVKIAETDAERFNIMVKKLAPVAIFALPGGPGTLRESLQGLEDGIYNDGAPLIISTETNHLRGIQDYFQASVQTGLIPAERASKLREWQSGVKLRTLLSDCKL